jgi:hypothetical protein
MRRNGINSTADSQSHMNFTTRKLNIILQNLARASPPLTALIRTGAAECVTPIVTWPGETGPG